MAKKARTLKFKAEVNQLLDILVHSLYTNREIFIRELISNASDALDKLRFHLTSGTEIFEKDKPLEISISMDKDKKVLTITDAGIGMTEDEIVANIGTIAHSGSAEFLSKLSGEAKDKDISNIIGKFGVGFYSVFMAAEKVVITTRSYLPEAVPVQWSSDGLGSYELNEVEGNPGRGTRIDIHLRENSQEFLEKVRLENAVKTHSNFIAFPIKIEDEQINKIRPIWKEPKSSISQEQYDEFYKFLSHDFEAPMDTIHVNIDAPVQFYSLLFFPKKTFDFLGLNREDLGLDLYVRSILIQHKNADLLPEFLGFVKGMVDSPDIPLNISRETLQENQIVQKISKNLVKQILGHLEKKAKDDAPAYLAFWKEHGKFFKMAYNDYTSRDKTIELMRFNSSANEDSNGLTSFAEYTERMANGQKQAYYISGASRSAVQSDPLVEIFRRKGIEVFYLYDPIDEFVMTGFGKYQDFELVSVEQADLSKIEELPDSVEEQPLAEPLSESDEAVFIKLIEKIKEILDDRVTEVRTSRRLKESASCLVNPDNYMTSHMQKILHTMNKDHSVPKKIFEINKDHQLTRNLLRIYKADPADAFIHSVVEQLFESALLLEGYLNDPHLLVNRIQDVLLQSSNWHPANK